MKIVNRMCSIKYYNNAISVPFLGGKEGEIVLNGFTANLFCDPNDRSVLLVRMSDKCPDHYVVLSLAKDFSAEIHFDEKRGYYTDVLVSRIEFTKSVTSFIGDWADAKNLEPQ